MTTREALRSYRQKTQDKPPHERVYFFHAHIYYDADDTDEVAKMKTLHETLQNDFSSDDHIEIHKLQVKALGPHPRANLEVLFTRERFTFILSYLAFTLPTTFSTLIHQLTSDQLGDHTTRAMWLGKQLSVYSEILERMDKDAVVRGMSEEEIIWLVHSHLAFFTVSPHFARMFIELLLPVTATPGPKGPQRDHANAQDVHEEIMPMSEALPSAAAIAAASIGASAARSPFAATGGLIQPGPFQERYTTGTA
ncbi:g8529 [Coccomyxa elongata]